MIALSFQGRVVARWRLGARKAQRCAAEASCRLATNVSSAKQSTINVVAVVVVVVVLVLVLFLLNIFLETAGL